MFLKIYLLYKKALPSIKGFLFRFFFSTSKLCIGKRFRCDTFPNVNITDKASITIANDVYLKRDVELRAHGTSEIKIANNVKIDRGVRLLAANNAEIDIHEGVRIGLYSVFNGGDSILIGDNTLISGFVYIQTSMHKYQKSDAIKDQGYDHAKIELGKDVWLGAHSVILPGTTLGEGSIIGSNAVVTDDVPEHTIVGGIPAKKIKKRFE